MKGKDCNLKLGCNRVIPPPQKKEPINILINHK